MAFHYLAVRLGDGPHVTPAAGVELAGRWWTTTAATAAKVRALRADAHAAVLVPDDEGWALIAGRAVVLDPRRPLGGLADPVAAGLVGPALVGVGLAHPEQLIGYARDAGDVPARWRPAGRVVLAVREERRLTWRDGEVAAATGAFEARRRLPPATRRRRRPLPARSVTALAPGVAGLVTSPGACALGLLGRRGPVMLPGSWEPGAGTVTVAAEALAHVGARLPGPCSVTVDDSVGIRPTSKAGALLRGDGAVLATPHGDDAVIAVRVRRITTWDGFDAGTVPTPAA